VAIAVQAKPAILPAVPPVGAPGGPAIGVPMPAFCWVNVQPGEIYLMPGKPAQKAADTSSSIRIRPADKKMTANKPADHAHHLLVLEVSPEPRLSFYQLQGVKIDRAIDNNNQKLTAVDALAGGPGGPGFGFGGGIAFPGGGVVRIMPFPIGIGGGMGGL